MAELHHFQTLRTLIFAIPYHEFDGFSTFQQIASKTLSRPLGTPWGPLGNPLGIPWGPPGTPWGALGDPFGPPWGPLGDPVGPLGYPLGAPWHPKGSPRTPQGVPKRSPRAIVGRFWALEDRFWISSGRFADLLGTILGPPLEYTKTLRLEAKKGSVE